MLELTESFQRFVFVDVAEEPLLSLGRDFSAPAIFRTAHSRAGPRHPDGQGQRRLQPLGSGPDAGRRDHAGSGGQARGRWRQRLYRRHRRCAGARRGRPRLCRPDADAAHRKRTGGAAGRRSIPTPSTPPASAWCAPSRGPSRPAGAALRTHARCRRFQPRRQGGRTARPAQRGAALSHRRRRRSRGRAWPTRITAAPPT